MIRKAFIFILFCFPAIFVGQQYLTYTHGGLTRDYILYLPNNLPADAPLVFMLHGYSGSASGIMGYCGMNKLANENKFAVCYPQGKPDSWGNNFWNVGYDFHLNETVDDVDFIVSLADYLQKNYKLSTENTFCSGMSNGGDMSYMLACQASSTFKAAAPVAGCMMKWIYDSCNPDLPMPIFAFNGTNDNTTWWNGDVNNVDGWGAYMGVEDAIGYWSQLNKTDDFVSENLPDNDPNDGSHIISEKHIKGKYNHEVWLYKIVDGGHDWPGAWGNMDIHTGEEVWNFFDLVMSHSTADIDDNNMNTSDGYLIYPNPASSFVKIELPGSKKTSYEIYNLSGKHLTSGLINDEKSSIEISHFPKGLYFLHINNKVFKLLKE